MFKFYEKHYRSLSDLNYLKKLNERDEITARDRQEFVDKYEYGKKSLGINKNQFFDWLERKHLENEWCDFLETKTGRYENYKRERPKSRDGIDDYEGIFNEIKEFTYLKFERFFENQPKKMTPELYLILMEKFDKSEYSKLTPFEIESVILNLYFSGKNKDLRKIVIDIAENDFENHIKYFQKYVLKKLKKNE